MGARGGGHAICLSQKGERMAIYDSRVSFSHQEGRVGEKGTGKVRAKALYPFARVYTPCAPLEKPKVWWSINSEFSFKE